MRAVVWIWQYWVSNLYKNIIVNMYNEKLKHYAPIVLICYTAILRWYSNIKLNFSRNGIIIDVTISASYILKYFSNIMLKKPHTAKIDKHFCEGCHSHPDQVKQHDQLYNLNSKIMHHLNVEQAMKMVQLVNFVTFWWYPLVFFIFLYWWCC